MYCLKCGKKIEKGSFCPECQKLIGNVLIPEVEGAKTDAVNETVEIEINEAEMVRQNAAVQHRNPVKKQSTSMKIVVLVLCLIVVLTLLLRQCGSNKEDDNYVSNEATETTTEYTDSAENQEIDDETESQEQQEWEYYNEDEFEEDEYGSNEETSFAESETEVGYFIDNSYNYMAYHTILDPFYYEYMESPDGEYSFYYPVNCYNIGLWETSSLCVLQCIESGDAVVFSSSKFGNDAMTNMQEQYSYDQDYYDSIEEIMVNKEVSDDGYARAIFKATTGADTNYYVVIAGNDEKAYKMEISYPADRDETDPLNYYIDCMYRYCSFSGATKEPRSFEDFQAGIN